MTRDAQIVEEAAAWIDRLNRPVVDAAVGPAFDAWMAAAPRHREVIAELQALWQSEALVEALGQSRLAPGVATAPSVITDRSGRLRRAAPRFAAAACAMLVAVMLIVPALLTSTYRTNAGRGRSVVLGDGSRVDMSGDTELRVQILPWKRSAELVRGEAFFDVRHERVRIFRVASGTTSVRVLGTAFNVDRQSPTRTAVVVYRGAVEVGVAGETELVLNTGYGARVVDGHVIAQRRIAGGVPDWKSGWFEASDVPLGVLIDKVQRYSARPILLHDRALQALPISGRFHVSDTERALQAVQAAYHVDIAYGPKTIAIRPAGEADDR
ncbi:FecR domain-containing protein [Sphingomonas aurantiaca]|uniref:FecR family protein n=1 Tax=Sphingomonas aurantiaca TaxID=185949 RepID=A0A2T5GID3_9SPHN|nr:FecR domain-containing protein [Sphingomonas aurantiaca]PTQ59069.1 FecR family protein [Sphingomonas aurantiaca]